MSCRSSLRRRRWRFLSPRDAAALVDALRRCVELLDTGGMTTDYHREEVAHAVAVGRRFVRHYDPKHETDLTVA